MSVGQGATALLKVVAALAPLMGNREIAEGMTEEIKALFESMNRSANAQERIAVALNRIDARLAGIEEKLQGLALPLSSGETQLLIENVSSEQKSNGIDDMMPDLTKVRWNE